jgi:hypothetical protein
LVTDFKGSIKGTTFQRNAAGNIAKGKSNSRFSPSQAQQYELTDFASIASKWNGIGFGYKDEWNVFAGLYDRTDFWGSIKHISGYQWFMSINRALSLISQPLIEQIPGDAAILPVPAYTIDVNDDWIRLDFGSPINISDRYIIINVTGPRRFSSGTSRQQSFYLKQVTGAAVQYINFTTEWEALFHQVWATFYNQNNAGVVVFPYSINLSNGVSSAYNVGYWSKL